MADLQRVPITPQTMTLVTEALARFGPQLDYDLTTVKNREYGDAWQAEGPFLAASRMKDKITRVETVIGKMWPEDGSVPRKQRFVQATTVAEGFQDILEMMQYGKMLMLYWIHNGLGLAGTEEEGVRDMYNELLIELKMMTEQMSADATRNEMGAASTTNSAPFKALH